MKKEVENLTREQNRGSKFEEYWREYKKPTLIRFEKPKKIKLCDLRDFMQSYKPFYCSDVYLYERFEYGDFGHYTSAMIKNIFVDPAYSYVDRETGKTRWELITEFYAVVPTFNNKMDAFWNRPIREVLSDKADTTYIDEIEIEVSGVFVISWTDRDKISRGEMEIDFQELFGTKGEQSNG